MEIAYDDGGTKCILIVILRIFFISVINQLDAQNVCFTISLFHASTCFEHMRSSSGRQNCITQPLVSLFHASTCFEHMRLSSGGQNCITQPLVSSHV